MFSYINVSQCNSFIPVFAGLSHDKWHSVNVMIDTTSGNVTLKVDDRAPNTDILTAYTAEQLGKRLTSVRHRSIVSVGGKAALIWLQSPIIMNIKQL